MAQQNLNFGTSAPNDGEVAFTAFTKIQANFDELYGAAGRPGRVFAGGIIDTLATNDSSANARETNAEKIQEALDYASNNGLKVVNLSSGVIYSDPELYQDAPDNLRAGDPEDWPATPTNSNFSLHLRGAGSGVGTGDGTELHFTDNTTNALIVGTGQNMAVSGLSIIGPGGASSRAALDSNGIGIALAGGQGGLSRCMLFDVCVDGFRRGVVSGFNADQLCDSVTILKSTIRNCYRGWDVSQTQNYINTALECTFQDNSTHIYSAVGKAVNVIGGNYSATVANKNAFTIGSTSALSSFTDSFAGSSFTNWTFTTTLAADDQPMIDGAYDAFVVKTVGFGLIPLVLTDYNSGTRVATFKFYVGWLASHYKGVNVKADTDIEAEIQADSTLYACETVTPFYGTGINVIGAHVENPAVLTRLLTTEGTFAGDRVSSIGKLFANYNINHADLAAGTAAQQAVFYCQQAFPFLRLVQGSIDLSKMRLVNDSTYVGRGKDGVNIEVIGNTADYRLKVAECDFYHPNITVPHYGEVGDVTLQPSMLLGAGEWDSTPFIPGAESSQFYAPPRLNSVAFRGWRPEPSAHPRLTAAQLTAIEGGPGSLGTYPPLCGDAIYSVLDGDTLFARSKHDLFSYGQNLSVDWEYKGQTNIINVSDTSRFFAGLRITIDNGGGDQSYTVTGVYATLGYVTVQWTLAGDKATTYDGSTIKQAAYDIIKVAGV